MRLLSHPHPVQLAERLLFVGEPRFCPVYSLEKQLYTLVAGLSIHRVGNAVLAAVGKDMKVVIP
jgi:hypothetical protein